MVVGVKSDVARRMPKRKRMAVVTWRKLKLVPFEQPVPCIIHMRRKSREALTEKMTSYFFDSTSQFLIREMWVHVHLCSVDAITKQ